MQETWVWSLGWEDPWRRKWQPTAVFLPGESMDRGAWWAAVHGVAKSLTDWARAAQQDRRGSFHQTSQLYSLVHHCLFRLNPRNSTVLQVSWKCVLLSASLSLHMLSLLIWTSKGVVKFINQSCMLKVKFKVSLLKFKHETGARNLCPRSLGGLT